MVRRFAKYTTFLNDVKLIGNDYSEAIQRINEHLELDWRNVRSKSFLTALVEHSAHQVLKTEDQLKKLQSPLYFLYEGKQISETVLDYAQKMANFKDTPEELASVQHLPWDAATLMSWSFTQYKNHSEFGQIYDWFHKLMVEKSKNPDPDKPYTPSAHPPLGMAPSRPPTPLVHDSSRDDFVRY